MQSLPYGEQIQKLEQSIGYIAQNLQAEILTKVTTLLTDNIDTLIPDLSNMRKSVSVVKDEQKNTSTSGNKALLLSKENEEGLTELKGEFEYMKTRFSPQFMQRVDKSLAQINAIQYDLEVVKMTTSHAAMKKDLDMIEQRLQNYVLKPQFMDLQHQCMDYALKTEIVRIDKEIEQTREMLKKFVLKTDFSERMGQLEREIWEELDKKQEKSIFT